MSLLHDIKFLLHSLNLQLLDFAMSLYVQRGNFHFDVFEDVVAPGLYF